jgi:hypothetical protein
MAARTKNGIAAVMRRYGLRDIEVLAHLKMQQAAFNGIKNGKRGEPTMGSARAICNALSACIGKEVLIDEFFGPNCGVLDYRVERVNGETKEVRVMNELSREEYRRDLMDALLARVADKQRAMKDLEVSLRDDVNAVCGMLVGWHVGDSIRFTAGSQKQVGVVTRFELWGLDPTKVPAARDLGDRHVATWVVVKQRGGGSKTGTKKLVMPWWNPVKVESDGQP